MFILNKLKNFKLVSFLCLAIFILDRILKYLALNGKIFFYKNYGLAFSVPIPEKLFLYFYIFIFLVLLFIIWELTKAIKNHSLLLTPYSLLLTGCVSNLIDRLKFGFIIDYLNFGFFYNNLADILICLGIVILILNFSFKK